MPRHQVLIPVQPSRPAEPILYPHHDLETAMVRGVKYTLQMCDCDEGHHVDPALEER